MRMYVISFTLQSFHTYTENVRWNLEHLAAILRNFLAPYETDVVCMSYQILWHTEDEKLEFKRYIAGHIVR